MTDQSSTIDGTCVEPRREREEAEVRDERRDGDHARDAHPRTLDSPPSSSRPCTPAVAVLGLGGIGGMLVARTGALGVGTEANGRGDRRVRADAPHDGETIVTRPEVVTRLDRPVSLLVVAVKAYALEAALDRIEPASLEGAVVLPLLNGLEHVDAIRAAAGLAPSSRPGASAASRPSRRSRASSSSDSAGAAITAASDDARALGTLEARARAARRARHRDRGRRTTSAAVLWDKAARLAVLTAASIAAARPIGALRDDPAWRPRLEAALDEACAVAAARRRRAGRRRPVGDRRGLPASLVPSAARDAAVGRPTELDAIAGSVVRAARRLGVWTPMLDGLLADAARHS